MTKHLVLAGNNLSIAKKLMEYIKQFSSV